MKGRKPTKPEQIYGQAMLQACGCVACAKLGYENDWPEPAEYIEVHHDPDKGSIKPLAHFFTYGLCPVHHRGATGGQPLPEGEPIRHSPLGSYYTAFKEKVGTDEELVRYCWEKLPLDAQDEIGEMTGIWSYDDLIALDTKKRNQ